MEEKQAGITALITAYARAYHATHEVPLIFNDFKVNQFYTNEERATFDQQLASLLKLIAPELEAQHLDQKTALSLVMQLHLAPITLSRSRYCEDCLEEAVHGDISQYIILGAGFDTFAFRRSDLENRLQIFEIDHPITQALKRQRIAMAGWLIPVNLHLVPVNFSNENLLDALIHLPYDQTKTTFFSWLGVTYYLSNEDIENNLRLITKIAPRGSTFVFDYLEKDAFLPEKVNPRVQLMQAIAYQVGEPMKVGFKPSELADYLLRLGFNLEEDLNPAAIEARYFADRNDRYHAFPQIHFAKAAIM